jgi:hypothetical protein
MYPGGAWIFETAMIGFEGSDLLQDDVLEQEFLDVYRSRQLTPERRLMLALLTDAIDHLRKRRLAKDDAQLRNEVWTWILDDDVDWVFSFVNCCEALDIEPNRMRSALQNGHKAPESDR